MWRVGRLVARRRCPTLGERAARSARTSYFSTVAPTIQAAWRPCLHPTWAAATPIRISTTTTPSVSWTAASASCRSQRAAADQHPKTWTHPGLFPVLAPLFHTVTQNQYQWRDIRRELDSLLIFHYAERSGHLGFRRCTLLVLYYYFLFGLFLEFIQSWSEMVMISFTLFVLFSVNQTNDLLWHSYLPYEKHFLNAWTFLFYVFPFCDVNRFYDEREQESSLKFASLGIIT